MHELSIMTYLLEAVKDKAQQLQANRVLAINLRAGERAGIVADSMAFYFDMLTPGTVVEGAQLNIRYTPVRFQCRQCDDDYSPANGAFDCPVCGATGQIIDDGSQLLIESIEIEQD